MRKTNVFVNMKIPLMLSSLTKISKNILRLKRRKSKRFIIRIVSNLFVSRIK